MLDYRFAFPGWNYLRGEQRLHRACPPVVTNGQNAKSENRQPWQSGRHWGSHQSPGKSERQKDQAPGERREHVELTGLEHQRLLLRENIPEKSAASSVNHSYHDGCGHAQVCFEGFKESYHACKCSSQGHPALRSTFRNGRSSDSPPTRPGTLLIPAAGNANHALRAAGLLEE